MCRIDQSFTVLDVCLVAPSCIILHLRMASVTNSMGASSILGRFSASISKTPSGPIDKVLVFRLGRSRVLGMEQTVRAKGSGEVRRNKRNRRPRTIVRVRPAGKEPSLTLRRAS